MSWIDQLQYAQTFSSISLYPRFIPEKGFLLPELLYHHIILENNEKLIFKLFICYKLSYNLHTGLLHMHLTYYNFFPFLHSLVIAFGLTKMFVRHFTC